VTLTLSLLAAPLTAAAPPGKMPRIGVLEFGSPPAVPDWKAGSLFLQELRKHGMGGRQDIYERGVGADAISREPTGRFQPYHSLQATPYSLRFASASGRA
jgi:hypothetical protein